MIVWPKNSDYKRRLPLRCKHCGTVLIAEDIFNNCCHNCNKDPEPVPEQESRYDELPIEDA
jgi:hypothetical protein